MNQIFSRFIYIIAVIMAVSFFAIPKATASDSVYTVSNIEIDVTASNAAQARDSAFAAAQAKAFQRLTEQLLSEAELEYFQQPDPSVVSTLIKDFEVTQEKLSSVRYLGTYTFRFKRKDVGEYLSQHGIAFTDVSSKPLLILPYYKSGVDVVLWSQQNPWLNAWTSHQANSGLVPVVIPIGDLQDVADLGNEGQLTYLPENLDRMIQRYGAKETVIMLAVPIWSEQGTQDNPESLKIMIYSTHDQAPVLVKELDVASTDDDPIQLFNQAVKESHKTLEQDWKRRTLVLPGNQNNLQARIKFKSMKEWVDTQQALNDVQGIQTVNLLSLKPNEAYIEIQFNGAENRLRLALAQSDMTLTTPTIRFSHYKDAVGSPLVYDLYMNKYRSY